MKKVVKYIVGVLLILCSMLLIGYSEYNIIKVLMNRDSLNNKTIEVKSTIIDKNNNGKLVFVNGYIILNKDLEDKDFNVKIRTSKLERIVEIYQYKETKEDDETYSYETDWYNELIDSSKFKNSEYKNPSDIKYKSEVYYNDVFLGAFKLNNKEIDDLGLNSRYLDLNSEFASKNGFNISNEYYTTSKDIDFPEVGDIRISFRYNNSNSASVIAKQSNNMFENYKLNNTLINKIYNEKLTKEEVIDNIYPLKIVLYVTMIVLSLILSIVGFKLINKKIIASINLSIFTITIMFITYNLVITILGLVICSILIIVNKKLFNKEVKNG